MKSFWLINSGHSEFNVGSRTRFNSLALAKKAIIDALND